MNFPIVYLSVFSIFLSLTLFFYNKGYQGANRFLSGYLLCSSAFLLTQYFFLFNKDPKIIAFFTSGFPSLYFLIGPLAYFYVRSILRDNVKLSKTDYFHFLPFAVIFIGTIPFIFSTWEYKCLIAQKIVENSFMNSTYNINFLVPKLINQLVRPPFALYYFVLILRTFLTNKNVFKYLTPAKSIKIWLGLFFLLFSLTALFYIIVQLAFYLDIKFLLEHSVFYYFTNSIALLYLVFNFSLALFPQILYGLPIPKLVLAHSSDNATMQLIQESFKGFALTHENRVASANAFFSDEYALEIETAIQNWIAEKNYLQVNASLVSVSTNLKIPVHHLTYYFNEQLNVKYTDWRNSLRIDFAKVQIDDGYTKASTLEALSSACGFASQSTFIRAFKNILDCTPSEYIKTKQI